MTVAAGLMVVLAATALWQRLDDGGSKATMAATKTQ